jgi:hypothetical protein
MGWELVPMGMRVGRVFWRKRGLLQRPVPGVRDRMVEGMVAGIPDMSLPVNAGS